MSGENPMQIVHNISVITVYSQLCYFSMEVK